MRRSSSRPRSTRRPGRPSRAQGLSDGRFRHRPDQPGVARFKGRRKEDTRDFDACPGFPCKGVKMFERVVEP
uniref:Uncharacterized protein n=1 Tax=Triticum urartu TaxID=4572 RepID=A0A8R7US07_TRIUA